MIKDKHAKTFLYWDLSAIKFTAVSCCCFFEYKLAKVKIGDEANIDELSHL